VNGNLACRIRRRLSAQYNIYNINCRVITGCLNKINLPQRETVTKNTSGRNSTSWMYKIHIVLSFYFW